MTDKELKRLSRSELLELLLIQTKETERLAKRLEKAEAMLSDRQLQMEKAGDIAHAVLEINGVMEAAQAAAQQYLDNVKRMDAEASQRAEKLMNSAREEIDRSKNPDRNWKIPGRRLKRPAEVQHLSGRKRQRQLLQLVMSRICSARSIPC